MSTSPYPSPEAWSQAIRAAARPFGRTGADKTCLTAVFHIPGCFAGVVHVPFEVSGEDVRGLSAQLGAAIEAALPQAPTSPKIVWKGLTLGPVALTDGVAIELEEMPSRAVIERLHITQTLDAARKLSEESVLAVCTQMQTIYELARTQTDGLKRVAAQFSETNDEAAGQVSRNIVSTIQDLSDQLQRFGREMLDRTNRQARDIEQARAWTTDIVKLGQSIASIANNARILTFNARLESARIGEAGRGFAVIAGSIQELAAQVREANQSVADLAGKLLDSLPRLGADALDASRSARTAVSALESQLQDVQTHLADVRAASFEAITDSSGAAKNLQDKANVVIQHLQFQDRASQMMEEVASQAAAVMQAVGIEERPVAPAVIEQVGQLGRSFSNHLTDTSQQGSVELF